MPKQKQKADPERQAPGPGRSTANVAFDELRKEIAERNDRAQHEAHKLRAAREQEALLRKRQRDF